MGCHCCQHFCIQCRISQVETLSFLWDANLMMLFFAAYFWGIYYYRKDWSDIGKNPIAVITFSFSLKWILLSNANEWSHSNVNSPVWCILPGGRSLSLTMSYLMSKPSKKYAFGSHFTHSHLPPSTDNQFSSGILLSTDSRPPWTGTILLI